MADTEMILLFHIGRSEDMKRQQVAIEVIGVANILRRITFLDGYYQSDPDGPTSMQRWFLRYIWEHQNEDVFQKNLEAAFKVRRSTATEVLKAMERKMLIQRTPCIEDKRSKKITLTEKGLEVCRENRKRVVATDMRILNGISEEEIGTFLKTLEKIRKNLEEEQG